MKTKIKDTTTNFSPIELDLINKYAEIHNSEIEINESGFITIESEVVKSSFKVSRKENKKVINVCHVVFGKYDPYECFTPPQLQKALMI
jgi:hypothetical protein